MATVSKAKPNFQPVSITLESPEEVAFMFALFNFTPLGMNGLHAPSSMHTLSEAIEKEYGEMPEYEHIHDWLDAHWKHD